MNRYFKDKPYVLKSDVIKLNKKFYSIKYNEYQFLKHKFTSQIIDPDRVSSTIFSIMESDYLLIWINSWTDKAVLLSDSNMGYYVKNLNKGIIEKISNKFNDVYINTKLTYDKLGYDNVKYKGYKFSKSFEFNMLLFNALLDRIEETPDFDKIVENVKNYYSFSQYADLLKLPVDLSTYTPSFQTNLGGVIEYVIKKDYPENYIYITTSNYNECKKLIKHLEGYKLTLKIRKTDFNKVRDRVGTGSLLSIVMNKFKVTRLVKDTEETEGNLTIKLV